MHELEKEDLFRSIVRIHASVIADLKLKMHGLSRVRKSHNRRSVFVQVRTIEEEHIKKRTGRLSPERWILMDEELRSNRLGLRTGESYSFSFRSIGRRNVISGLRYLAGHENPVVRITFWLAFLSIGVSLGGILLTVVSRL